MKHFAMMFVAAYLLAACGGETQQTAAVVDAKQPWATFAAAVVAENYRRDPELAVDAGLHEYDGQMSDFSLEALAEQAEWLEATRDEAASYTDLVGIEAFERDYLIAALADQLFGLRDTGFPTSNPLFYSGGLSLSIYVDREYAPIEERIKGYTAYAAQIPALVKTMQTNLQPPLPAPFVEVGYGVFAGFADYLENTVPDLFSAVEDEQLLRQFEAAKVYCPN